MLKDLAYYRRKFSSLRVSRSAGIAPNKPVLLLCTIELINRGEIPDNRIELSPELIATFLKLWSDLEIDRKPDIGLPFFHLRGDRFWHLRGNPGFEFVESSQSKVKVRSVSALRQAVQYATLDPELFALLQRPAERNDLTLVLIDTWFADKTEQIRRSLSFNAFTDLRDRLLATGGKLYQPEDLEAEDEQTSLVRDGAFRRIVTSVYEHRCAFCGLQVLNALGQTIVDAAHIMPFSQFYDDRISNGLSLCKNHHWAFDRFWFSLNDDCTIVVDEKLREVSPHATPMQEFQGRPLLLPANAQFHPRPDAIAWHRQTFIERVRAS